MERKTETEKGRDADGINEYTVQCAVCENNLEEDKDEVNTFTVQYFWFLNRPPCSQCSMHCKVCTEYILTRRLSVWAKVNPRSSDIEPEMHSRHFFTKMKEQQTFEDWQRKKKEKNTHTQKKKKTRCLDYHHEITKKKRKEKKVWKRLIILSGVRCSPWSWHRKTQRRNVSGMFDSRAVFHKRDASAPWVSCQHKRAFGSGYVERKVECVMGLVDLHVWRPISVAGYVFMA